MAAALHFSLSLETNNWKTASITFISGGDNTKVDLVLYFFLKFFYLKIFRKYEWGTCVIANPSHCDFNLLYNLLLGLACIPLRYSADVVYEKYI